MVSRAALVSVLAAMSARPPARSPERAGWHALHLERCGLRFGMPAISTGAADDMPPSHAVAATAAKDQIIRHVRAAIDVTYGTRDNLVG
jgi:hypothetical protein